MDIWEAWEVTKRAIDYRKAEAVFKEQAEKAAFGKAALIYVLAGIYTALISVIMNVMTLYIVQAVYVVTAHVELPEVELTGELLMPYLIYYFGLVLPMGLVVTVLSQAVVFKVLQLTGGKGTFMKQLYLYSFLTLGLAAGSTIMLAMLFPCLGYPALIGYFIFALYVQIYLQSMMLRDLHQISMTHAMVPVVIVTILTIVTYTTTNEFLAGMGIGPPMPEQMLGIDTDTVS